MLIKLTPVVNFINILRAASLPIFFQQKIKGQSSIREQLRRALLVQNRHTKSVDEIDTCSSKGV